MLIYWMDTLSNKFATILKNLECGPLLRRPMESKLISLLQQQNLSKTLILNPDIQPPEPNRVNNHMENIESLGWSICYKMPLHLFNSSMHSQILTLRYSH